MMITKLSQRVAILAAVAGLVLAAGTAPASAATASVSDTGFTYSTGWTAVTGEHYSGTTGSTATINFTASAGGSTFALRGEKNSSNHTVSIVIDGGAAVSVNENGATTPNTTVYTSPLLAAGGHTAKVTVVNRYGSITGANLSNGTFGGTGYVPPVTPPGSNTTPDAGFSASTLTVALDASASTDPDGTIATYAWDFGDATAAGSGKTVSHTYATTGTYTVKLTVTDNAGGATTTSQPVTVGKTSASTAGVPGSTDPPNPGPPNPGAGWTQKLVQNFDTPAALGTFAQNYPGWDGYDTYTDTSGNGQYNTAKTTTVHDGLADVYVHTEGGQAYTAALTPSLGSGLIDQKYGRYEVRFKEDVVAGYKTAWLLWPTDDNWSEGEIDFPEGPLGGLIEGYSHDTSGTPSDNAWYVNTNQNADVWHTAVIEWTPTSLTYKLDAQTWTTAQANAVPQNLMHWVLQTETQLSGGAPPASAAGHVYIDYAALWSYTP